MTQHGRCCQGARRAQLWELRETVWPRAMLHPQRYGFHVASATSLINCAGLVAKLKECEAAKVEFARIREDFREMPAKDIYHDAVKNALVKDGWIVSRYAKIFG